MQAASQQGNTPASSNAPTPKPVTRPSLVFLAIALFLVAINLRPLLTGLGPVLDSVRESLHLSGGVIGMLITLPILCFGAFATFVPRLLRYTSSERIILIALAALVVGIGVRSLFDTTGLFLGTFIGGASISVIMVLLPSIIKQRFPGRASMMLGLYSTSLCVGAAIAAGTAVPLESLFGGWRWALAFWLFPAFITIFIWLPHVPKKPIGGIPKRAPLPKLRRSKLAWQVTLLMGLQSSIAYCVFGWLPVILIDRGLSALNAGFVLSLAMTVQLISSPIAPWFATRGKDQRFTLLLMLALTLAGLMGLFYAPITWIWVSGLTMGFGMGGLFSITLTLLVLRAPNSQVAAALSGMVQGIGYTIAAIAPFVMGLLHEYTAGWNAVAALFVLLIVGSAYFAMGAGRNLIIGAEET